MVRSISLFLIRKLMAIIFLFFIAIGRESGRELSYSDFERDPYLLARNHNLETVGSYLNHTRISMIP